MPTWRLEVANLADAPAIARLRNDAADALTAAYGRGHWSGQTTERGVAAAMHAHSAVYVVRRRGRVVATLLLQTKKPWAIDTAYFTPCRRPLYLMAMAVDPKVQRTGIGRACLEATIEYASAWPADAIRLDAYDADAGAGGFYAACGYREVGRVVYRDVPLVYYELPVTPARPIVPAKRRSK
jgi:GNAT superfamily N-acetyltransferase